ncbi:hypothetical protein MJO28_003539 [Puccinia striiformis f. sp. tritici]|uniref:HPt domain-containing protein n=4 Tax=Puccinia striiformis TaxID=27350 RepID=A0A0L0V2V9_9BASI|nr:hypothetical protein MJO28_003539 [Puccinia striiformis f. sp. tritici]KAI9625052.1 hypothetical protein KEM48_008595 [Puccinia striiformis f. sp. tritici PST-130]KNE93491.1 hypothetical protein PSTG_13121 [Puccinia striiformis f. sp. tritici PST-78]POV98347.1 hypothetical protein PSTT_14470 [Puccinia striiformis]POW06337.1 hypothetical protein PSHT_10418 [Puccinia striiformis]
MAEIVDAVAFSELIQLDEDNNFLSEVISEFFHSSVYVTTGRKADTNRESGDYHRLGQEAVHLGGSASALGLIQVGHICDQIHIQCRESPTNRRQNDIKNQVHLLDEANRRARRWLLEFSAGRGP